jgi:CBS domain containing-hemolysin-like protein
MLTILIITAVSLVCAFFCSLAETCIYSITRSRIESLRREGKPSGARLAQLRANIDETIAAILILNTFANSFGAVLAGGVVDREYGSWRLGVLTASIVFGFLFTSTILFFSEIIPKSLGVKFANRVGPALATPLVWLVRILKPLVLMSVAVTRLWGKGTHLHHATEEDIINLAALGQRQGQILPQEAKWVANALRLNDMTAYDLMTPNTVVARLPETLPLRGLTIDAQHWRFSRIPVCLDDNPDAIVGVIHRQRVFDALAKDQFHLTMRDLMIPPDFVDEKTPAHQLLDEFLKKRRHLFCVKDEAGAFIGVVTLEDVLECLLGLEIVDERDAHVDMQELARQRRQMLLEQSRKLIEGEGAEGR